MRLKGVVCVLLLVSRVAVAQVETKLAPVPDIGEERYGTTVSAFEDRIVVGAPLDDAGGLYNAGAVYVYDWDGATWQETAKVTPSDPEAGAAFGTFVLLASDRLFVESIGTGVVYLFEWDGAVWQEVNRMAGTAWRAVARQTNTEGNLGPQVAISGNALAVGSSIQKTVDLFQWEGSEWVKTQELTLRPNTNDEFGGALVFDGDRLVVSAGRDCSALAVYSPMGGIWTLQEEIDFQRATFCSEIGLRGDEMVLGAHWDGTHAWGAGGGLLVRREAGVWTRADTLHALDPEEQDHLGSTLAFTGSRIVLGAPYEDERGEDAGAVYVYERQGDAWQQTAKLTASDATRDGGFEPIDRFGFDAALRGDHALVADAEATAYLFTRSEDGWREAARIRPQEALDENSNFPPALAINDRWAFIGFSTAQLSFKQEGAVYLYQRRDSTWHYAATLVPDTLEWSAFGQYVHLHGDEVIIGAATVAYIFSWDGAAWNQTVALTPSDARRGLVFPRSVAVNDQWAFVGARLFEPPFGHFVYLYQRQGEAWVEVGTLERTTAEGFGHALAVQGNRLLVGAHEEAFLFGWDGEAWQETARLPFAPGLDVPTAPSSIALGENLIVLGAPTFSLEPQRTHFFTRDGETWSPALQLPDDVTGKGGFGRAVALDGDRVLITAPLDGANGAAYLYEGLSDLILTPIEEPEAIAPNTVRLTQNYPNPASQFTTFTYQIDQAGPARLEVFDLLGRKVATVEERRHLPGVYTITLDVRRLAIGPYLYKLTTETRIATQQMMVIR